MSDQQAATALAQRRVFLDCDGVLADFDGFYFAHFGELSPRAQGKRDSAEFWARIEAHGQFYRVLPRMLGAQRLYFGVWALTGERPTILTGVPRSVTGCVEHKQAWVAENIDPEATVICCPSAKKRDHMKPGDILIDDWPKYRDLWEQAGGTFITHTSASDSLAQLRAALASPDAAAVLGSTPPTIGERVLADEPDKARMVEAIGTYYVMGYWPSKCEDLRADAVKLLMAGGTADQKAGAVLGSTPPQSEEDGLRKAFYAGWRASEVCERDDDNEEPTDVADAPDVAFSDWMHKQPTERAVLWTGTPPQDARTESWAVTVERNGEAVVTIASNMLAGRDLLPGDDDVIRDCAEHLRSFVGPSAAERAAAAGPAPETPRPDPLEGLGIPGAFLEELDRRPAPVPHAAPGEPLAWLTRDVMQEAVDAYNAPWQYDGESGKQFMDRKINDARDVLTAAAKGTP